MQRQFTKPLLLSFFVLLSLTLFGQGTSLTKEGDLTGGKWYICSDTIFASDFKCKDHLVTIEFFKDKKYRFINKLIKVYSNGKWHYSEKKITLKGKVEGKKKNSTTTLNLIWIDKDTFYITTQELPSRPIIYTYYQRR